MTHNDYLLVIEIELVGCLYLDHFPNDHFCITVGIRYLNRVEPRFVSG